MTEQVEVKLNLFQKIHAVMKDVEYLKKDDAIKFGNTSYKAISEEKVTSTIRQALVKYGLVIMPVEQEHSKDGNLTTVNTKYKIVDIDSGQFEIIVSSGTGADTQDKGVGKAMTYSYKYLLLRTFAIPTGEDPDKISSAELDEKMKSQQEKKEKDASTAQLNTIDRILTQKASEKYSKEQLYQLLKQQMNTDADMEHWTESQATQAMKILNKKGA